MARYALVIGISQYEEPFEILSKAATDAYAVKKVLEQPGGYRVEVLVDGSITRTKLVQELKTFLQKRAVQSEALIYFTGHGFQVVDPLGVDEPEGYLATSDCTVTVEEGQITGQKGGLSLKSLNKLIQASDPSNLVVLLDACHSGNFLERDLVKQSFQAFCSRTDYYLITGCRSFEQASAKKREQHSVFTGALLGGLSQTNADEYGKVTGDRLFDFIYTELHSSKQEPIRMGIGRSIVLVEYLSKTKPVIAILDEKGEVICPYQGLQAFDREQKEFFFGRKRLVEAIKQKLDKTSFIPIIGASGSGKSSVVRAGLIPWLEEERNWQILKPIKPGSYPLEELRGAFKSFFKGKDEKQLRAFIEDKRTYPKGLVNIIEQLTSVRFLLVVDQFEEVFTVCTNEEERQRFIELIAQVTEISDCRLAIVTTMRADFLEPCLRYAALYHLIQTQAVYISPLKRSDLRDIIVEPAKRQGYEVEEELQLKIWEDVGREPGFLPLLEFALTKLWEQRNREKRLLTLEQYEKLGGLSGALHLHAERVYQYQDYNQESPTKNRSEQEKEWIKRILLRLIRAGEGQKDTRQRQLKAKLLAIAGNNSDDQDIISDLLDGESGLVQARLIVADEDKQGIDWIDLAHEALMDGWHRFKEWRQVNQEVIRLVSRIEDDCRLWNTNYRSNDFLLPRGLLAQVRRCWSQLKLYIGSEEQEFYQLSQDYEFQKTTYQEEIEQVKQQMRGVQMKLIERIQQGKEWSPAPIVSSEDDSLSQDLEMSPPTIESEQSNHPDKPKLIRFNEDISDFLEELQGFGQQMTTSRIAAEWLSDNRLMLVENIVQSILAKTENSTQNDKDLTLQDVDKYISWLCEHLLRGQPDSSKLQAPLIFSGSDYTQAFEAFEQKLASYELASEVIEQLQLYLNSLLRYFRSLQQ